jgi:hypothetical protein
MGLESRSKKRMILNIFLYTSHPRPAEIIWVRLNALLEAKVELQPVGWFRRAWGGLFEV